VGTLLQLSVGGTLLGIVWAIAVVSLLGRVQSNSTVEPLLLLAMSYLLFYTADEQCHVSSILAVVVYGLCFLWFGKSRISPDTIHDVHTFLENAAFISETVIVVLCGAIIATVVQKTDLTPVDWAKAIGLWFFDMAIRGLMVLVLSPLLNRYGNGFGTKRAAIMTWGGLR
jgi:NhaP-type Na+/H+ or K+/H+ antiporter